MEANTRNSFPKGRTKVDKSIVGLLDLFPNMSAEAVRDFVSFMRSSYWKTHFEDFIDLIYWYFASEKKVRVI